MPDKERKGKDHPSRKPDEKEVPGLPEEESVTGVEEFTSPKGNRYRILRTDETDAYDDPDEHTHKPDPNS